MYLDAYISGSGGTEEDIQGRLGKAWAAHDNLDLICQFNSKMKINCFQSNVLVLLLLLYECETWEMTTGRFIDNGNDQVGKKVTGP